MTSNSDHQTRFHVATLLFYTTFRLDLAVSISSQKAMKFSSLVVSFACPEQTACPERSRREGSNPFLLILTYRFVFTHLNITINASLVLHKV